MACWRHQMETFPRYWPFVRWRLRSPHSRLFTQSFIQAHIKENIKAPRHWPLWGEFTGGRQIPRTNGQWRGKCFHLMTSSCNLSGSSSSTLPADGVGPLVAQWWSSLRPGPHGFKEHVVASLMSLMASLVTTSRMQQCNNALIYLLVFTMNLCYCFIVVFCFK